MNEPDRIRIGYEDWASPAIGKLDEDRDWGAENRFARYSNH
jgi:hypothetical protein